MFKRARLKLTAWYLLIIMVISLSFSVAIYTSVNSELVRIDRAQSERQARVDSMQEFIAQKGFAPPQGPQMPENITIEQTRVKIITMLGLINISILVLSGLGGYFLAGQTLEPISKMLAEQKKFVSNASHELRTPLTSLKTEIEVGLRDKKMTLESAQKLLKSNLEDVNGMEKLSDYLLDLNRYENIDIKLETKTIELGTLVISAIENCAALAHEKGVQICKHISKTYIKSDDQATLQLAMILIDNAIKYSGKSKKIDVYVNKDGELVVKDYGIGISEKETPFIFDRFYRADISRTKQKVKGYGLGLSIAKSITNKLGAKIKVESKIGKGSTFSVQFPTA